MVKRTYTDAEIKEAYEVVAGPSAEPYGWLLKSGRTWIQYAGVLNLYGAWCAGRGVTAIPADQETLGEYLQALIVDQRLSTQTADCYIAALATAHHLRGLPFDRAPLGKLLKGWRKRYGRPPRRARPLYRDELQGILARLDLSRPRDCRNACLLVIGWSGALRRAELISLDWQYAGGGDGYVARDGKNLIIGLHKSKARDSACEIPLPTKQMPTALAVLERWIKMADVKPGTPLFRPVYGGGHIGEERLGPAAVGEVVKEHVEAYAEADECEPVELRNRVKRTTAHSLRAGYASSAARARIDLLQIQAHTRHKSLTQLAAYIRDTERWMGSGLEGVGF